MRGFDARIPKAGKIAVAEIVTEDDDLGWKTNVWGVGINTAARILAVSAANQLLVSKQ